MTGVHLSFWRAPNRISMHLQLDIVDTSNLATAAVPKQRNDWEIRGLRAWLLGSSTDCKGNGIRHRKCCASGHRLPPSIATHDAHSVTTETQYLPSGWRHSLDLLKPKALVRGSNGPKVPRRHVCSPRCGFSLAVYSTQYCSKLFGGRRCDDWRECWTECQKKTTNHVAFKDRYNFNNASSTRKKIRQRVPTALGISSAAKGPSKGVRLAAASSLQDRKPAIGGQTDTSEIDQAPGIKPAEAPGIRSRRHSTVLSSSGCFSNGCHHLRLLSSWQEANRMRQHSARWSPFVFTPEFAKRLPPSSCPNRQTTVDTVPMTESYYMGSSCRGSIRSCDFQSSNNSAASPVSARNALLSESSINALVTDRELFTTAASVVPKLRAVVEYRKDAGRSSSVWQAAPSDRHHPPCWVVKKKQHGAEISEFDRAKLASAEGPNWFRGSARANNARHSMIESCGSLYTRDAFVGEHTHSEVRARELVRWPVNDLNVTYAVSAHVTLSCRLDEAMTMLFSRDSLQFDSSMGALFGARKYKSGDLFVSREFRKSLRTVMAMESENAPCWEDDDLNDLSQPGWVALQSVVLRSRRSLNPMAAAKHTSRRQRLCFAAYSQYCPDTSEAFYTMKTLPKPMHDKFTRRRDERASEQAIRGDMDHIAAGYHFASSYSDLSGHQTRIIMTAYVSSPPAPKVQPRSRFWGRDQRGASVRRYAHAIANAEAKYVVNLLAAATTSFEQLVRRRRLGYQPFRHIPVNHEADQDNCSVCLKSFGLLRPQRFCQLCAHRVCRECSRKFDVEPVARRVRRNRICFACVANVDASVFQQENPLLNASFPRTSTAATAGIRISDDEGGDSATGVKISTAFYDILLKSDESSRNTQSAGAEEEVTRSRQTSFASRTKRLNRSSSAATATSFSSTPGRQLADALFSSDPLTRARALEVVRQVMKQVTSDSAPTSSTSTASSSSTFNPSVPILHPKYPDRDMVDRYLEARLHLSSISMSGHAIGADSSDDMPRGRSNSLYSRKDIAQRRRRSTSGYSSSVRFSRSPMVPRAWTTSANLETELDLDDGLDSAALDSICEVAALRMRCSIAYIVALNGAHSSQAQRVVGSSGAPYRWSEEMTVCPFPLVANGKPFVIKDPMRDPQLRHLRLVRDIGVRFFAGFPITSPDGSVVACLCTVDSKARDKISLGDLRAMHALSKLASDMFEEEVNPYTPRSTNRG